MATAEQEAQFNNCGTRLKVIAFLAPSINTPPSDGVVALLDATNGAALLTWLRSGAAPVGTLTAGTNVLLMPSGIVGPPNTTGGPSST